MVTFYKIVLHAMVILVFESEESTSDRWWDIAIAVNVPGPFLLEGGAETNSDWTLAITWLRLLLFLCLLRLLHFQAIQ